MVTLAMAAELPDATPPHVAVIAALISPLAQTLSDAMMRESVHVEITTAEVLRHPVRPIVHVFLFDASLAIAFANAVVQWAERAPQPAGLIGVVEEGTGDDREALLAAGFDDAISGRTSPRELLARVRAVQRRIRPASTTDRLRYGPFTLDLREHVLWTGAHSVHLTPIEMAAMRELIKARGRPPRCAASARRADAQPKRPVM